MNFVQKICIILVFVLVFIGCVSHKNISQNDIIGLTVENVPEGILLSFSNIPTETNRMFIHLMESYVDNKNPIPLFTDIRGIQLDKVKETGRIICPFGQNGVKYIIGVSFNTGENYETENWVYSEIIADKGIHSTNDLTLELNNTQTRVMLSAEPIFSSDVQYAAKKYRYTLMVRNDENNTSSYSETLDDNTLSWNFRPEFIENINNGNFPAYVTAYCNINYDNMTWIVGIASSDNFKILF
jgi:hypothetical protein